jgi:hypothetical protein
MDRSSHPVAHSEDITSDSEDITSDSEADDETTRGSHEAPTPDSQSSIGHHVSDDAAGDEGIDEPVDTSSHHPGDD